MGCTPTVLLVGALESPQDGHETQNLVVLILSLSLHTQPLLGATTLRLSSRNKKESKAPSRTISHHSFVFEGANLYNRRDKRNSFCQESKKILFSSWCYSFQQSFFCLQTLF